MRAGDDYVDIMVFEEKGIDILFTVKICFQARIIKF